MDNLVKCIQDGFSFSNSHFTGGVSKADASPMREEAKKKRKENLSRKTAKVNLKQPGADALDADYVATTVKNSVSADLCMMGDQHNPVRSSNPMGGSAPFDACNIIPNAMRFANNDTSQTNKAEVAHAGAANENVGGEDMAGNNRTAPSRAGVVNNSASPLVDMLPITICDVNAFHIKDVPDVDNGDQPMNEDAPVPLSDIDAHVPPIGKASDQNVIDVGSLSLDSRELSAIVDMSSHLPAKVVDVLIHHTRSMFLSNSEQIQSRNSVFLDKKFVSLLAKTFTKFSKSSKKESFRFPPSLCEYVVIVLDCNTSLRMDGMITNELHPISQMFPYLLRQAGKQLSAKYLKTLTIERPSPSVGGVDVSNYITPDVLDVKVERIAVMIYEENLGVL
ncbi:unnamed protein product [Brassica oleracea]